MFTRFAFLCTVYIYYAYAQLQPLSPAPYSPFIGNIPCNTRINGSTNENDAKVYWSFYLDESIHSVILDSCSSKYNTKLWLYHYWNTTNPYNKQGWKGQGSCDDCSDRFCYPNEFWTFKNKLEPGHYMVGIGGYADHVGDYSVFLKCDTVTPLYISKTGIDSTNCGLSIGNPCGTIYYASTLIVNDYMELYVTDGQNETQITIYKNTQSETVNYCLPVAEIEYIFYVYFDAVNIQTMTDWYPKICVNNNNQSQQYMFKHSKDLKFENLIIDNYIFYNQ
eukprot:224138_1